MQVGEILGYLYPGASDSYVAVQRGDQVEIALWDPALGPQPTPEQLGDVAQSPAFQQYLLTETRRRRVQAVDARTSQLLSEATFDYQSRSFSLRQGRLMMWNSLAIAHLLHEAAAGQFPAVIPPGGLPVPAENGEVVLIADQAELLAFLESAMTVGLGIAQSSHSLLQQIAAAQSPEQVAAVIDDR